MKVLVEGVIEESRCATIRLGFHLHSVPLKHVYPLHPSVKHQRVLAFEGEHQGQELKVMEYGKDLCSVSLWAKIPLKKKACFDISTLSLVLVIPL